MIIRFAKILSFRSFGNLGSDLYTQLVTLDIKSRLNRGESDLHGNTVNCQNIMARIAVT